MHSSTCRALDHVWSDCRSPLKHLESITAPKTQQFCPVVFVMGFDRYVYLSWPSKGSNCTPTFPFRFATDCELMLGDQHQIFRVSQHEYPVGFDLPLQIPIQSGGWVDQGPDTSRHSPFLESA